ncbi:MAG: cell division protein FtsQ/DivIB [Thermacetogeniaceae bacterium]|jgi:cell division protein FtsQ|nr:FtsQ-type POTRA domain-containing protein [Thermoanaerobacterales bacterium]NLN22144.1 FtsQ-type POTRA domain-containing protein [Syntrophomonadaceae bacterium]
MSSSRTRKKRRVKRNPRKIIKALRNLLIITSSVLAFYYFTQSPFFALKEIEVKGNKKLPQTEIVQKSGLSLGINYFDIDTGLVAKRLSSIPVIASVEVNKKLPNRMEIVVEEREPLALYCTQDSFAVIDGQGYCIEKNVSIHDYDLPIITGLIPDLLRPGEKVSDKECLQSVLAVLGEDVQQLISEIDLAQENSLIAYTRQGIPLLLGTPDQLSEKIEMAVSYLDLLGTVEGIEYMDIRSLNAPAVKCEGKSLEKIENSISIAEN